MKFEEVNKTVKLDKRKTKKYFLETESLKIINEEPEKIQIYKSSDYCYESKYFRENNFSFASLID
jgi:hypothetical protein